MLSLQQPHAVGRFAPSPTGRLHAGNIFAYLMAWLAAKSRGGRVVLRIEDLDAQRSRAAFADALMRDLEALGLEWDGEPLRQSERSAAYAAALDELISAEAAYECFCSRAEAQVQAAPHLGEGGGYAGACRDLDESERARRRAEAASRGRGAAIRCRTEDEPFAFDDLFQGPISDQIRAGIDDFVLRRSDGLFAYQLAVVVDDAAQGVGQVVRGCDLLPSVRKQAHLQRVLGLPQPRYGHIPLLVNEQGRRLSKRDGDASLDAMLREHGSPAGVIGHIAAITGIIEHDEPVSPRELLAVYDEEALRQRFCGHSAIEYR